MAHLTSQTASVQAGDALKDCDQSTIAFWTALRKAERVLTASDTSALKTLDITLTQYAALMGLHTRGGRSAADMARCLGVSAQAAHNVVTDLQTQGLAQRDADEYSDLIIINTLTHRGIQTFEKVNARLDALEQTRIDTLGKVDHHALVHALEPVVVFGDPSQQTQDAHNAQDDADNRNIIISHLGAAIRNVHRQATYMATDVLKATGTGISLSQALVLGELGQGERPIQRIADAIGLPQQTVSYATGKLLTTGYVVGRTAPRHKRLKIYSLTPSGAQIINRHAPSVIAPVSQLIGDFDVPVEKLTTLLDKAGQKL